MPGFDRSPLDEIKAIQRLLDDVYKDAGDGRTLFRELVQNADDAGARRLRLAVLDDGWPDTQSSLLRGPALLVANDGAFPDKDRKALHKAIGGSKEDDVDKIGTFGIGLKSVFHICEALVYLGANESDWQPGVLNPWCGTGENGEGDPLHSDWDDVVESDAEQLRCVASKLLGQTSSGLLLWVPLRLLDHLDRGTDGDRYGLGEHCPEPGDLSSWFQHPAPAALLLAQCGHLDSIEVMRAPGPEDLPGKKLMYVSRQTTVSWLGRHRDDDAGFCDRTFEGEIVSNDGNWSVVGVEALGRNESLRRLQSLEGWPQTHQSRDGRVSTVPRKALAHAAVTVLRPRDSDAELSGTRLRWAAFLPLDDDPEPRSSAIVACKGSPPAWEIILHGYFWTSQDRRSIPGVTEDTGGAATKRPMRILWNQTLCEDLLLPLLPNALASAVGGVDQCSARRLLDAVARSDMVENRLGSVRQRHWLLPVVDASGVRWTALEAESHTVLSIPKWSEAPEVVRQHFLAAREKCSDDVVFIDDDVPRLAGVLNDWTAGRLERLLASIPADEFKSAQSLRWIRGVFRHILGPDACGEGVCAVAIVRWLAKRVGEGALANTTRRSASPESRDELRRAWRDLCEALPRAWLVETPVNSQKAVTELAAEGVVGEGLFPMPFGRRGGESPPVTQLDQKRLDRALSTLGRWLQAGGESERLRHSRLLLAEALLSRRSDRPMGELKELPLLRVTRLPEDHEEAWSVADPRITNRRVFASPMSEDSDDGADGSRPKRRTDWKRAVTELAETLDEAVWVVNGEAVASVAKVPPPSADALASAVLQAKAFADPECRKPLLMRLASDDLDNDTVRRAARVLFAGRNAEPEARRDAYLGGEELFHDRTGNDALHILLGLLDRSWCAVPGELAESLSQEVLEALAVHQVDHQVLHRLLDECLDKSVDWRALGDRDALVLLRHLYGTTLEEQERWCRMPLHRGVDGIRGAFDHRARRWTGKSGELQLPPELEEEVRLLDPDQPVAHLYDFVPIMDHDGVLRAVLEAPSPWRFAEQIVRGIHPDDGPMTLPRDRELRELLRHRCWLPLREGDGLAPDAALVAPEEVLEAAAELAPAGAFGDKRLPDAVDLEIWLKAKGVVREILGRPGRDRQIQRLIDALNPERVAQVDHGAWLVMHDPERIDASFVEDALHSVLVTYHRGWKMVHTVALVLRHGAGGSRARISGSRDVSDLLVTLAEAFCAPVPLERQIEMLKCLAKSRPVKDSPDGRVFRRLLKGFAKTDDFFTHVLPTLDLPTQDGSWHASRDVARTETGVARRHLLIRELRSVLRLDGDDSVSHLAGTQPSRFSGVGLDTLEKYFEPWRDRVPHGAVGAFLSLLGDGPHDTIKKLAQLWLGEDVAIEPIEGWDRHVNVGISSQVASGTSVSAMNVLGSRVEMEADADRNTLFAEDPILHSHWKLPGKPVGPAWEITLRDVASQSRSSAELIKLLGGTVERWAWHLGLNRERVKAWWSRWGKGSQADFGPVLASINAHLPLTLHQLDVQQNEPLRDALRGAERAQRRREQASSHSLEAFKGERNALSRLATLIKQRTHHEFLWKRVREVMRRYGYGPDSALLELAQNADDALAQAAEIRGDRLPPATRCLLIQVHEHDGKPTTVDVTHWGRLINDTGGTAFPAGKERQWDQDLYFMMLMNLSGKPGERLDGSSSATTGRFGLGFKSVHLVSSSPSVVSGFIAFSVAGGLLPLEHEVPAEMESWVREGRRPTRVRLPLHQDIKVRTLIEHFGYARALLPVFARQVREVVVEGGPFPGVHTFDGKPVDDGAPGWSIGTETKLPNHDGHWRILRFRPADAGLGRLGTAALAVGLRDGTPTAFGPDVPFLWNVAPTSESWGCGYAVNGPVKLDPGRTHVSLDDTTTLRVARDLGEALGKGLIELHDMLDCQTGGARCALANGDPRDFLSSLWQVLATGLDNPDELRRAFLLELHGNGRGMSAWTAARPVVPSGLPEPFQPVLPPLTPDVRIEVASDDLADDHLCAVLAKIEDEHLAELVDNRCVVSAEVAQLLPPLGNPSRAEGDGIRSTPLCPSDLFAELAERWDHCLTPERLHALRPIGRGEDRDFDAYDPRRDVTRCRALKARAADGSLQPLRYLLLRDAPSPLDRTDLDGKDELRRAAFAPDDRVLDPAYVECSEDWRVLRWLRVQHRIDAAEMAEWCTDLPENHCTAMINYLLYGELGTRVLQHLAPLEARPHWLREYDDVCRLVEDQCKERWRCQSLLGALFPNRFDTPESPTVPVLPEPDTFFQQLLEWWDDDAERAKVISAYEKAVWPNWLRRGGIAEGLQRDSGSADHWLALLVLGACQSLGRTQDQQHRSFLELAYEEGWWDVFRVPKEPEKWMDVLDKWQERALDKLAYPQWMSLFPAIYQLSRYLSVYVGLLKSAGERPQSSYNATRLLAPRVDEALTGAGTHFDAPPAPLNMGIHWVHRELVRLEVINGEDLFRHCWVPAEQVLNLLRPFGLVLDEGLDNSGKAHEVYKFLTNKLGTTAPNLHRAFDIPLRHVAQDEDLRRRFGLEQ